MGNQPVYPPRRGAGAGCWFVLIFNYDTAILVLSTSDGSSDTSRRLSSTDDPSGQEQSPAGK